MTFIEPTTRAMTGAVPYANWPMRAAGYIIDYLIVAVPVSIGQVIEWGTENDDGTMSAGGIVGVAVFGAIAFVVWLYNRVFRSGRTGQSWGRSVLGTTCVGIETGRPIGPLKAFLRDLCHILDTLACYIGWLFPIWDAKRQTFADKIMSTVVVR